MQNSLRTLTIVGALLTSISCGWQTPSNSPPPEPADGEVGLEVEDEEPTPDWLITYTSPDPNVMLVVDRSGSMNNLACTTGSCDTRWKSLVALGPYLEEVKQNARLGLALYPTSCGKCSAEGAVRVDISDDDNVDERIMTSIGASVPGGATPTADALDAVGEMVALQDEDRENIVVLLTDGAPNCACGAGDVECERMAAVESVARLSARGIKVFIIGFGVAPYSPAEATLTAMADAAEPAFDTGEHTEPPEFYSSETVETLIARLYTVSLRTQPCRFDLERELDLEDLVVSLDGEEVTHCEGEDDCQEGFSYDEPTSTVEFHQETCAVLQNGSAHELWFGDRRYM